MVQVGYAKVWFALGMSISFVCVLFPRVGQTTRMWFLVEYGLYTCSNGSRWGCVGAQWEFLVSRWVHEASFDTNLLVSVTQKSRIWGKA